MANKIGHALASQGLLTDVDTVQKNALGALQEDESGNSYVYQQGIGSLAAGDFVVINGAGVVARTLNTPLSGPVGVAMAAILANQFGWFQRRGVTAATTNIATDNAGNGKALFLSSSAGRATTTAAAGCAILGAWAYGNPASNVGPALLSWPNAPGFTLASA
jgi:hypothetical protein